MKFVISFMINYLDSFNLLFNVYYTLRITIIIFTAQSFDLYHTDVRSGAISTRRIVRESIYFYTVPWPRSCFHAHGLVTLLLHACAYVHTVFTFMNITVKLHCRDICIIVSVFSNRLRGMGICINSNVTADETHCSCEILC